MARITVEDCIDKFPSRFELVLVAANRARKLHSGDEPLVEKDNDKNTVIALREIAEGAISTENLKDSLIEEHQVVSINDDESDEETDKDNNETLEETNDNEIIKNDDNQVESPNLSDETSLSSNSANDLIEENTQNENIDQINDINENEETEILEENDIAAESPNDGADSEKNNI